MVGTPAVDLNAVIATKADLEHLATKADVDAVKADVAEVKAAVDQLGETVSSAFNLIMGEIGKIKADQEETRRVLGGVVSTLETHGGILANLVAKSDGVE